MKLGAVETVMSLDGIENGTFCHIKDPGTGEPLYLVIDGKPDLTKPVRVMMRSITSSAHRKFVNDLVRSEARLVRKIRESEARQEVLLKRQNEESGKRFSALATIFENFDADQVKQEPSDEEKMALALAPHTRFIADQCLEYASEASNYPGEGAPVLGNGDATLKEA